MARAALVCTTVAVDVLTARASWNDSAASCVTQQLALGMLKPVPQKVAMKSSKSARNGSSKGDGTLLSLTTSAISYSMQDRAIMLEWDERSYPKQVVFKEYPRLDSRVTSRFKISVFVGEVDK